MFKEIDSSIDFENFHEIQLCFNPSKRLIEKSLKAYRLETYDSLTKKK